jgi:hypothetical protein
LRFPLSGGHPTVPTFYIPLFFLSLFSHIFFHFPFLISPSLISSTSYYTFTTARISASIFCAAHNGPLPSLSIYTNCIFWGVFTTEHFLNNSWRWFWGWFWIAGWVSMGRKDMDIGLYDTDTDTGTHGNGTELERNKRDDASTLGH